MIYEVIKLCRESITLFENNKGTRKKKDFQLRIINSWVIILLLITRLQIEIFLKFLFRNIINFNF